MSAGARRGLALIAIAYLGYVSLGLPDGLLGVAWPSMRATFRQPLDALGPLLASATLGYLAFPGLMGVLAARSGLEVIGPSLIALGLALMAAHEVLVQVPETTGTQS